MVSVGGAFIPFVPARCGTGLPAAGGWDCADCRERVRAARHSLCELA
ncbi:MAG: hypothetical protein NC041_08875 [Bacteroides sp.]|nr:hypothetical protein [Bacteroides sp.]